MTNRVYVGSLPYATKTSEPRRAKNRVVARRSSATKEFFQQPARMRSAAPVTRPAGNDLQVRVQARVRGLRRRC